MQFIMVDSLMLMISWQALANRTGHTKALVTALGRGSRVGMGAGKFLAKLVE